MLLIFPGGRMPPSTAGQEAHRYFSNRLLALDAVADDEPVWSVIPNRLVRQLGPATYETRIGRQAFGVEFKLHGRTTSESTLIGGRKVLVGRTVLMGTDLVIDPSRARVIPNPKHPDGPVFRV